MSPFPPGGISCRSCRASFSSHDVNGGLGGIQGGCNYQVGSWVFGIQGDYDWSGASGSNNNVLFPFVAQSNIRSLASVTGRVGYAWDRFLLYAKGGGAWARDEYSMTANVLIPGFTIATASETRGGWTVGIGGEYAFLDWLTGFVEYDYYGFGTKQNTFGPCGALVCGAPQPSRSMSRTTSTSSRSGSTSSSARRLRWWADTDRAVFPAVGLRRCARA